jgi:DNA-directed RNA polymerase subunit M/transcription elongation factor TFIIS
MASDYTIEDFSDCELQPEAESRCPECGSNDLAFAMHFRESDDDEDGELFQCRDCRATGSADDTVTTWPARIAPASATLAQRRVA